MTIRRSASWMLAAAGCAGALVAARAYAAGDGPIVIRPVAVADSVSCWQYQPGPTPAELRPFVTEGKQPLCAAAADLDGDGRGDYVLVLGSPYKYVARAEGAEPDASELKDDLRTVLVLTRQPDGALRVAARTEHAAMCAQCGGMFGDPFEGVTARRGEFTLYHYGGSAWRWRVDYTFRHHPSTGRWRLARVEEASFHTSEPDRVEKRVHRALADFDPVDLTAFVYETWRPRGAEK